MPGTLNVGGHNIITHSGTSGAGTVDADNIDTVNIGNNALVVDSSGNVGVGTSSPTSNVALHLKDSNTQIELEETSGSNSAFINFDGTNLQLSTSRNMVDGAFSNTSKSNATLTLSGSAGGSSINMYTASSDNTTGTERMRIDSSGNGTFYGSTFTFAASNNGMVIHKNSVSGATNTPSKLAFDGTSTGSITCLEFKYSGSTVGSIVRSTGGTSYNTSSDYRLKENITEITDGISRVKQLNPSRFNFIVDPNNTVDGFIAHEVQTIVPEAISGEKDAVDEDGSIAPQGIDQSKLVPLLTAALQEAIALIESQQTQIDALTTRIEALENA